MQTSPDWCPLPLRQDAGLGLFMTQPCAKQPGRNGSGQGRAFRELIAQRYPDRLKQWLQAQRLRPQGQIQWLTQGSVFWGGPWWVRDGSGLGYPGGRKDVLESPF